MVLQALNRYYDILAADPESGIPLFGYSIANVGFALVLAEKGDLLDVISQYEKVQRGKATREVPRRMIVPAQVKRAYGISANFLCDNSTYVLGLSNKEASQEDYARKRFEAFRELNIRILQEVDCLEARAVIAFLEKYDPVQGAELPQIAAHLEELLAGSNIVFQLSGYDTFVHHNPVIKHVWEQRLGTADANTTGQCLVTGEIAPIARLHANLKGITGAQPTGAALVSFNNRAYESYNRIGGQGLNSPVSEKAAFAYTTVLNFLLSRENPNRKVQIGDTTVVYWAESSNPQYAAVVDSLFDPEWSFQEGENQPVNPSRKKAEQRLAAVAEKVHQLEPLDVSGLMENLEKDTRFYVLGLAPNVSRIAIRFFYADAFEKIIHRMMQHYTDLQIQKEFDNQPTFISLRQILSQTVSLKSKDPEPTPLLGGAVMRAILENRPYPEALYTAVLNRIRVDTDDADRRIKKINYVRAAVIKACLIRKYRNQNSNQITEVLCMSLNEQSTNRAYLLGRLFAVLEKAQKDAIGDANATITDRYFASACATPATVFPILLRLSRHHISKAEYGYTSDRRIEQIMALMDIETNPFPAHLSLDEQGLFVLGYYHQRSENYTKNNSSKMDDETHA